MHQSKVSIIYQSYRMQQPKPARGWKSVELSERLAANGGAAREQRLEQLFRQSEESDSSHKPRLQRWKLRGQGSIRKRGGRRQVE